MNIQEIYGLLERFEGSAIAELEIEHEGTKLKLKKGREYVPAVVPIAKVEQGTDGRTGQYANANRTVNVKQTTIHAADVASNKCTEVKAPLVGTFYRAPSPEDKPFVMVGQSVKKGDVLGIIEAMKLMNEILAPEDGVVESILAENGSMVEYNQVLLSLSKGE